MAELVEELARQVPDLRKLQPFAGATAHTPTSPSPKSSSTGSCAVRWRRPSRRSGLRDGMTISFHHAFREGDKVINQVVGKLAEMGFRNLRSRPARC